MSSRTLPVLLLIASAACLACPRQALGEHRAKARWTVMIYMNADNNLDSFALLDFEEMAKVRYNSGVNVVVQLDRLGGKNTDTDWGETRRFVMRRGIRPIRSHALPGFDEESNMGDPATLASFVSWAKENFPAERYMLVVWSHGDGWRRPEFKDESPAEAAAARRLAVARAERWLMRGQLTDSKLASVNLTQTSLETQFRTISEDQTNDSDKLYVREMQNALEGVFRDGRRLDVIGFDACLMQMIETGYAMRNVADVMVGSEELEPMDGWRYDGWLQMLSDNPRMGPDAVGRAVVDSYQQTFGRTRRDTTLSAIKLSGGRMARLAGAVSAFSDELMRSLGDDLRRIRRARLSCRVYAPGRGYHGIDLHRFSSLIARAKVRPKLRTRAKEVAALIDSLVVRRYAGSERRGEFGSRGLAIYFPADSAAYRDDRYKDAYNDGNEYHPIQFVKDHLWDNFLHAYFQRA